MDGNTQPQPQPQPQPVCAEEALDLLNCVAASAYDQDKCLLLLTNLRNCVLSKKVKKFSLSEQPRQSTNTRTEQL